MQVRSGIYRSFYPVVWSHSAMGLRVDLRMMGSRVVLVVVEVVASVVVVV